MASRDFDAECSLLKLYNDLMLCTESKFGIHTDAIRVAGSIATLSYSCFAKCHFITSDFLILGVR